MLADMGRIAEALEACQAGALRCVITGDRKARRELLELAAQLGEVDEA
jgi:ATP:corrinoid adenosyltransferase